VGRRAAVLKYLRTNFDTAAILASLATVAFSEDASALSDEDQAVLAALRRSNSELEEAPLEDIRAYLQGMDSEQIAGLVSNVKGILHEMEFVRLENEDADPVYASYFSAINHPDTDIQLIDASTGETWEVQLKATSDSSYVQDWIENHPDGEILVTEELAEDLDLPTSGLSNEELTVNVTDFVERLIDAPEAATFWDHVPALSALTLGMAVWELWKRYQEGEIAWETFKQLAARATGLKIGKIVAIATLLAIPGISQVTTIVLMGRLILNARTLL